MTSRARKEERDSGQRASDEAGRPQAGPADTQTRRRMIEETLERDRAAAREADQPQRSEPQQRPQTIMERIRGRALRGRQLDRQESEAGSR